MTPFEQVVSSLEAYGSRKQSGNWNCPGPLHGNGDRKPSLSVDQGRNGVVLHCFTGCATEDIVTTLGLSMPDLQDEPREVARYPYVNSDGEFLFSKVRFEPKTFIIEPKLNGAGGPLYRLPEVTAAIKNRQTVFVVEGEKDVDRLWSMGIAATCNYEGAGKWKTAYGDALKGATVVIVADRDDPGVQHAMDVYRDLRSKARSVRIVQSRTVLPKDDISDHLDAGFTLDQLEPFHPENEISKNYRRVNWLEEFKRQPDEVDWLIPPVIEAGTVNALYGKPGVGKSLITLEFAMTLVREGKSVMYVDDENRVSDTVERLRKFGCTADELDRLIMYNFCGLPPLDTPDGGQHLTALAEINEPCLVILDTLSRMTQGDENSASTWLQLYRNSLVPMKSRGIAVLRLDHSGKDVSRGQRGSSAKDGDVDCIWRLSFEQGDTLALTREKSRSAHGEDVIIYKRMSNPLRHEIVGLGADLSILKPVQEWARRFDTWGVPRDAGRPRLRDEVKAHYHRDSEELGVSTTVLALVARYRKGLSEDSD